MNIPQKLSIPSDLSELVFVDTYEDKKSKTTYYNYRYTVAKEKLGMLLRLTKRVVG